MAGNFSSASSDPIAWQQAEVQVRPLGAFDPFDPFVFAVYQIRELFVEIEITPDIVPALTQVQQRRGVMNFFDVTALANNDISWFSDPARSEVHLHFFPSLGVGTARVNAVFWAIEMRPNVRTAIEVPRVFTDIRGIESLGRPTEIVRDIITRAEPLGLDATVPVQGEYANALQSLDADAVRLDFAIRRPISARQLISDVADQADLRQWWDVGRHSLRRKLDPANLPANFRDFVQSDVVKNSFSRQRSSIGDVVNEVEAGFRPNTKAGGNTRVDSQLDAPSQVLFGQRREVINLGLIRDEATAALIVARRLTRQKDPRYLVVFRLPLFGLELQRGDLVKMTHILFGWSKAEVVALPIVLDEFAMVEVNCIVWRETSIQFNRDIVDSVAVAESVGDALEYERAATDSVAVTDSVVAI